MRPSSEQKHLFLLIVLLFCISILASSSAFSQLNKLDEKNLEETMRNPWKDDRSVFLQEWLVLGSIPISSIGELDKDFMAAGKGEANLRPKEGEVITVDGKEMKWKQLKCKDVADFIEAFSGDKTENAVAYAYTTINRKEAGKLFLSLGSDDGIKVWFNGSLVHRSLQQRGVNLDEDNFAVNANAGENHLLMKIQQGTGSWGFAIRLRDNLNQLDILTGNIDFSLGKIDQKEKTVTIHSRLNIDPELLKQTVDLEVYTTGGKDVARKTYTASEPVVVNYSTWPDGVYEFRFTYKDIRGVTSVKYLSWYKGDVLAAARDLVNTAPSKEVRTPEASIHRMLADMILDRLANNLENPDSSRLDALHSPLMEFAEIKANKQIRAGGFIRMTYIDDIDNSPQFCRSYLPLHYDQAKKWPLVVYLHGYNGGNPEYYNWWSADKRHDVSSDKHDVIFIEPHGRGNTQYRGIGDRDIMQCIEMAKQKFNVDEDRVYLVGSSMGGFGTWNVATRHPELFAGIAPIYGGGDYHVFTSKEGLEKMSPWDTYLSDKSSSTAQFEALLNMPILVSHGDKDQAVDVNLSRYLVRMLQRWDYDVRYNEVPGKGHTELGLWDQIIPWMLEHKRNPAPRHVRVRAAELRNASAYWVEATQKTNPFEFMIVDAEALEGNNIRVDSKNATEIVLTPDSRLIDYMKPVRIIWNGKTIPMNNIPEKKIVLRVDGYKPLTLHKTPLLPGPLTDLQNTPFLIVVGTVSSDSVMKRLIDMKAGVLVNSWKTAQKYELRVKNDVNVTEEDMKRYTLLLLGGPADNAVSKRVIEKIPFRVTSDEIVIDGKSFNVKDAVLCAAYPSPYNTERYIGIVASTSASGMAFFDPNRGDVAEYDYYILDGTLPSITAGATLDKIMVASGFFDPNWKIEGAFLNEGNGDLRAKCATVVVNPDLSLKVISTAQPSAELLKLYTGMYQITGGPQVKVFFENNTLQIAQGNQSLEMVAVSDSEFYIKEINVSLVFQKDDATNDYIMIVHQAGQQYQGKKMK